MLALPLRLSLRPHLFGTQNRLVTSLSQRSVLLSPRNVSRNGSDLNASETDTVKANDFVSLSLPKDSPLSGLEDLLVSFISGKKKATEVAHLVWKRVVQKGDTVIDATCGNGHDTLAMLKMVADESGKGSVYGMDIQEVALQKTSSLLEESVSLNELRKWRMNLLSNAHLVAIRTLLWPFHKYRLVFTRLLFAVYWTEKELVKLFSKCHSKMHEVLPRDTCVRLVAFNLGYLPGGDKTIITESGTTLKALEVAQDILLPGGLISLVVYVGHPGGWGELQIVQQFVSKLDVKKWICCEYQSSNRSWSPVLVFLFKRC